MKRWRSVTNVVLFLVGFTGVIICACEPVTTEQYMNNAVIGIAMLGISALIGSVVNKERENEFS